MSTRAVGAGLLLALSGCSPESASPVADPDPGETVLVVTIDAIFGHCGSLLGCGRHERVVPAMRWWGRLVSCAA